MQKINVERKVEVHITADDDITDVKERTEVMNYLNNLDRHGVQFVAHQLLCHPQSRQNILRMVEEWNMMYRF